MQSQEGQQPQQGDRPKRIVKRYSNRKLYDTRESRYVTLQQIGEMVRSGEEVQIIDNATKDDLTEVTLAQIIYEDQKEHRRTVPLATLRELIHQRSEKIISQLREGPLGRLLPKDEAQTVPAVEEPVVPPAEVAAGAVKDEKKDEKKEDKHEKKSVFEQIDERVRSALTSFSPIQHLQSEVTRLEGRIGELEERIRQLENR